MKIRATLILNVLVLVLISACDVGVNKTIYVDDGETRRGGINSVNGGVIVGKDCTLKGSCRTVNGRIEIGAGSRVEDLMSVNGSIDVDENVEVRGDVETVNGNISCAAGVAIDGKVQSINGRLRLSGVTVERDLSSVNGDIILESQSSVKGDLVIEGRRRGRSNNLHEIRIRIVNSVVEGDILVEDKDANVTVYLSEGGKVLGKIENAEVVEE